jgi:two-component system, NarL family, response regulator YdfI
VTRVLVAAASAVVRAGLEALVTRNGGATVVGSASSLDALGERVASLEPDVVLVALDPEDGDAAPPRLAVDGLARPPGLVVLADEPDAGWVAAALRAGVRAVLPREATALEISAAVEAAAVGLVVLHPDAADALVPATGRTPSSTRAHPPAQPLTPREVEVLALLAEGFGNKAIAPRLGISEHTVKAHVASIFAKLHATTRAEAVVTGARLGVIML